MFSFSQMKSSKLKPDLEVITSNMIYFAISKRSNPTEIVNSQTRAMIKGRNVTSWMLYCICSNEGQGNSLDSMGLKILS